MVKSCSAAPLQPACVPPFLHGFLLGQLPLAANLLSSATHAAINDMLRSHALFVLVAAAATGLCGKASAGEPHAHS